LGEVERNVKTEIDRLIYPLYCTLSTAPVCLLMTLPPDPSFPPTDSSSEWETQLEDLEKALQTLKDRYTQIQQDTKLRDELRQRQKYLETQRHRSRDPQWQAELQQIADRLAALDANLESTLVSWETFREPFWQAVRFGGLGIAIGWVLKSCTM
jgi:DNA repair exonuclease SbcCD ATPase subunit